MDRGLHTLAHRTAGTGGRIAVLWPLLFWTVGFAAPLLAVVGQGAAVPGALPGILRSPRTRSLIEFTLRQASLSAVFSVLFGLPGAYYLGRRRFPGRRVLKALSTVPFVLPPILAVLGFVLVFGNHGLLNDIREAVSRSPKPPWKILYSMKAIVLAHVFYNFPLTIRIVGDAWSHMPRSPRLAARASGAGPVRTFFATELPRLLPSILTAAILTFLFCFLSFAVVLVLGGGPHLSTLEVEVYRRIKHQMDFAGGSAMALVESSIALGILGLYALSEGRLRRFLTDEASGSSFLEPSPIRGAALIPAMLYLVPALLLVVAPLFSVIVNGFLTRSTRNAELAFSLVHWQRLLGGGRAGAGAPIRAVLRTLVLGSAVAILTTATASIAAWYTARRGGWTTRFTDSILVIPMGVSSVILGLGYLILVRRLPRNDVVRLASLAVIHCVTALPFAYRIIKGRLNELSPRIAEASRSVGAGPWKTLVFIEIPMARRALATAAVFALALSAGELNATLILAPGTFTTLPLAIYRMIGSYDISGACALGTVLIAISTAGFLALDSAGEGRL